MKVCKFEKMKEEDEIRQVINYTLLNSATLL